MGRGFFIYTLIHPTTEEVRYVGQTIRGLKPRLQAHKARAKDPEFERYHVYRWWNELKAQGLTPKIELWEECNNLEELEEAEKYWIARMRGWGFDLTNMTKGGDGIVLYEITDEHRKNLSKAGKGRKKTEEWKAAIGAAHRNRSPEEKAATSLKTSAQRKGHEVSDEQRKKISKSRAARSPEEKASTAAKLSARIILDETKRKISESQKIRLSSIEARIKISRSQGGSAIKDSLGNVFATITEAAKHHGFSKGMVSLVLRGDYQSTRGVSFVRIEDEPNVNTNLSNYGA